MQSSSYLIVETQKNLSLRPHPDHRIVDSTSGYGIEELRKAIAWTGQKPFSKPIQVLLISEIERCSIEGQNALLKVVEEPPLSTRIILTTHSIHKVLRTIRSRCTIGGLELLHQDQELKNELILEEIARNELSLFLPTTPEEAYSLSESLSKETRSDVLDRLEQWIEQLYSQDALQNFRHINEITKAKEAIFHNGSIPLALDLLFTKLQTGKLSDPQKT